MAKIKINLSGGDITVEFSDTKDLEEQLEKLDLAKIDALLNAKKVDAVSQIEKLKKKEDTSDVSKSLIDLGNINLLKISEKGQDAIKLAVFLAASGLSREEIKKIIGITILSS